MAGWIFLGVLALCIFGAYGMPLIQAARGCRHARFESHGQVYEFITYFPLYFLDFQHAPGDVYPQVTLTIEMSDGRRRRYGEVLVLEFDQETGCVLSPSSSYEYPDVSPGFYRIWFDDHFHLRKGYYIEPIPSVPVNTQNSLLLN